MRDTEYREWLDTQELAQSSVGTKLSDARRVDQAHGDLDEHYRNDRMASLLQTFAYSRADEVAARANPTALETDGNLYKNLASYRSALTTYRRFCDAHDHPEGRLAELDRKAILAAIVACDEAGSAEAFVSSLEDRGLPNKYWLVHAGKRYPSKAVVHWAMRENGIEATAGGSLCKTTLEELGFVVIDWPEVARARDVFLAKMPGFSDFRQESGEYWDVERGYKNQLIAEARAIAGGEGSDREAGEAIYRILMSGRQGVPLNWRTMSEVQQSAPELADRFFSALGVLARTDAPGEEGITATASEFEALRAEGIAGLRRGEVLSIPITVWATLHPDQASWFKISKIEEMGQKFFGRRLFPQKAFREQDLAEWLQLMRALFGLLGTEFGWNPRDLFDVQGFVWVALGGNDSADEDADDNTNSLEETMLDLSEDARPYWFVGAVFNGDQDQVARFLSEGIWQVDNPTEHQTRQVRDMQPGDRIAIKAAFVQQHDLPFDAWGRKVSVMRIKARGTVTRATEDGESVGVEWEEGIEPRDWYFYTYQPTIWRVGTGKEMSRRLIRFAFADEEQDIEWFMTNLSRWREGPEPDGADEETARQSDPVNLILYGPPGTGKTYRTMAAAVQLSDGLDEQDALLTDPARRAELRTRYEELTALGRIALVTFHQNFSYEEFVEGLRPKPLEGGGFTLVPKPGIFRAMADAARDSAEEHVLIIDEINRANISKVFGELITLIEPDKRLGKAERLKVILPYSEDEFGVPANLHIIGTMNTADRSIALLDTALRRRFRFEEMAPDTSVAAFRQAEADTSLPLGAVLNTMNHRIEYLVDRDHRIGHAFFIGCESKAQVDAVMRDKVIPLLQEYFFDDWNRLAAVLGEKDRGGNFLTCETIEDPMGEGGEPLKSWRVRADFDDGAYARLVSGKAAPASDTEEADPA